MLGNLPMYYIEEDEERGKVAWPSMHIEKVKASKQHQIVRIHNHLLPQLYVSSVRQKEWYWCIDDQGKECQTRRETGEETWRIIGGEDIRSEFSSRGRKQLTNMALCLIGK